MPTTTNPYPNVPSPAGAKTVYDWYDVDTPGASRYYSGSFWKIERTDGFCDYFCVCVDGTQRHDGVVTERQVVLDDVNLTPGQARELASALLDAAAEMDEWAGK
jgi:hypothetical protein